MAEPPTEERGATKVLRYVLFNWLRRHSDINCRDDAVSPQQVLQFWQGSQQAFQAQQRLRPAIQSFQAQLRPKQDIQAQLRPQQRPQQALQDHQRLQLYVQQNNYGQELSQDLQSLQQLFQHRQRLRELSQAQQRQTFQAQERPQQAIRDQERPLHFQCVRTINNRRYLLSLEKMPVTFVMQKITVHTSRLTVPNYQHYKVSDSTVIDNMFNFPSSFWSGPYRVVYKISEDYEYLISLEITRSVEQSFSP